jgi:hypothetical protein
MRRLTAGTGDERALSLEGSCHCRAFVGAALLRFGARGQTRRARGRQLRLSERAISPQTTMRSSVPGITSAIACVSIFFACVAPADAVQLVTEQEAGYPDDPYGIERGGPTPGPEVEVVSPALSGLVKSPFYLKIKFKAHGGAEIDRDSITITPLPFGAAFFREARTRPLAAFAVGAILGVVATCAMTLSVSVRYHQPIMPSDTFEWLENIEYVVSIALGFGIGNMLARLPGVSSWWPQKDDWVLVEVATALEKRISYSSSPGGWRENARPGRTSQEHPRDRLPRGGGCP